MGNVQNCDSYINVSSAQTYESYITQISLHIQKQDLKLTDSGHEGWSYQPDGRLVRLRGRLAALIRMWCISREITSHSNDLHDFVFLKRLILITAAWLWMSLYDEKEPIANVLILCEKRCSYKHINKIILVRNPDKHGLKCSKTCLGWYADHKTLANFSFGSFMMDHLCGLVVRVPGSIPGATIFSDK
jgi:hypothetical protein